MRLLRQNSYGGFELTTFIADIPPYAILSHTWTYDEVTYNDLVTGTGKAKPGYNKIKFCGERAARDGLQYFWVDTCCINKRDSSELNAAINSMFGWYRNAVKCYVYLSDVSTRGSTPRLEHSVPWEQPFMRSRWFTRAWTLQELIAPKSVEFFSAEGERLGDKSSLEQLIHETTRIPVAALMGAQIADFSISERLSWASSRESTYPEDKVYSLLGLFNIFMPLIYGEGYEHAFRRLQRELETVVLSSAAPSRSGMRLLVTNSNPLRLTTVPIHDGLQYGILSHTWGDDEVTFEDMRAATAGQKRGYLKLRACCDTAAKHGLDYVWIDTCCIDKSSSSELQEAICSMYMWYKNATICYVYLSGCRYDDMSSFARCKWFRRGWTLQELIAPKYVEFYDQNWNEIGTKQSLCAQIAEITSIDPLVLRGADATRRTIAERMSWAASRETTRLEDSAYSLMGLFKVYMPMLYGEGNRAFIRLQEEIIKQTEDYTIFSWKAKTSLPSQRGLFAHSPAEFVASGPGELTPRFLHQCNLPDKHLPPALSSRGLVLTLPLAPCASIKGTYLGWISCWTSRHQKEQEETNVLCVRLKEIQSSPQVFARISAEELESRPVAELQRFKQQTICVLPSNIDEEASLNEPKDGKVVVHCPKNETGFSTPVPLELAPGAVWAKDTKSLLFPFDTKNCPLATILFGPENEFLVFIGFQDDIPWCSVVTLNEAEEQGRSFNDLKGLGSVLVSKSSIGYSDRAKKSLSSCRMVTVALRTARSPELEISTFSLHVDVLHVS